MEDNAGAGPGVVEYDYNALLAKVDNSIAQSAATAAKPVVVPMAEFPNDRSLFYYLKGNHSFLRMYRTRAATLDLPRSVFILVFSIFFQLMLCIELTRAGLGLGGTWCLGIVLWQPSLQLVTWIVAEGKLPLCWPYISGGSVIVLIVWDLARGITYSNASGAIAAFMFVFVSNFLFEFVFLAGVFYVFHTRINRGRSPNHAIPPSSGVSSFASHNYESSRRQSLVSSNPSAMLASGGAGTDAAPSAAADAREGTFVPPVPTLPPDAGGATVAPASGGGDALPSSDSLDDDAYAAP